jgi:hypothetical protein
MIFRIISEGAIAGILYQTAVGNDGKFVFQFT